MVTLYRWILLKQKQIKYKLALYQFLDKYIIEIIKHPENIEKKILPYLAEIISETNKTNDNNNLEKN